MTAPNLGPIQDYLNWYPARNSGRDEIPAHGLCELNVTLGAYLLDDRRVILRVAKPTLCGFTARTFINGPNPIEPGKTGIVTDGRVIVAAYDPAGTQPVKGDVWGPRAESCYLYKNVPGGRVIRDGEDGRVIIVRYENFDLWGKLTGELNAGESATAKLLWGDPENDTPLQVVEQGSDQVRFTVHELSGNFDGLGEDDIIIARYDEQFGAYILRGWVC